jgi:hypothetical protein
MRKTTPGVALGAWAFTGKTTPKKAITKANSVVF